MVFKRQPGSLGVGGPTVDTVLDAGAVRPGGTLSGRVELAGGTAGHDVEQVVLELVARVETAPGEPGDGEPGSGEPGDGAGVVTFGRYPVGGAFRLAAGERRDVPFSVRLPWETPVTELRGRPLGLTLGVRAEPAAGGDGDRSDPAPLRVAPLPAQEAVLEAFEQLGFGLRSAGLEHGRIGGTGQRLPFRQEIGLTPSARYAHQLDEIELTFLAVPDALEVVLETDKRGGPSSGGGHDALSRFTVPHTGPAGPQDWDDLVDGWIRESVEHRESYDCHAVFGHESPAPSPPSTPSASSTEV
ncbi:sporulation protein [Streptomyces rochei]|uniref:Sporulation protein n=1 Tax=Streptomyces rochei TaxID=1928 RepID=A0ABW7E0G3_STRRO